MASSSSSISSSGIRKMNLSKEEMDLPPWIQMMTNGALDPNSVTTSDSACSSIKEDDSELEAYFSDEELSEIEHSASGKKKRRVKDMLALNLREYQKELAENALRGNNTIICAPTGSGKTRVATCIILEHLRKSKDKKKKVAFFAKTVPLAVQQYKALRRYLPSYEITHITGQNEEPMSLHILLHYNDIIVMTPQILENHLQKKLLPNLGVFSLLVFDECHHTHKKDPYNVLMTSYLKMKDQIRKAKDKGDTINIRLPQVLGLTATIGIDKAVTLDDAVNNILLVCASLDVSSLSAVKRNIAELKREVPVPKEKFIRLTNRDNDESVRKIHKIMENLENQLKHLLEELKGSGFSLSISNDIPKDRKSQSYEQWAVEAKTQSKEVAIHDLGRETNIPVRLSIIILEYLIAYRSALESYDLVELKDVIWYLERCFHEYSHEEGTDGENRLFTYFQELKKLVLTRHGEENPNLRTLTDTLNQYLIGKGDLSRGIIFVRTRFLAEALSHWLKRCDIEAIQNLNACSFTGSNIPEEKGGTSQTHQEEILQRFRSGEVRLLVATSVAEEGLDIQECNLVIKYNHVGSEVSTVQTRGRCRQFGGVSVLMAMDKILQKERINYYRVKLMRKAIKNILNMHADMFKQCIENHQTKLLQDAYIAELLQRSARTQYQHVPFRMVCAWCRKVGVDSSNVKTIECHHISIDRDLLDHIVVVPDKKPKQIDDCLLVGVVLCKGEPEPGSKCMKKLGRVIKHQQIPYVVLTIECFAFYHGNQGGLITYKKWKETEYVIESLSYDDINRYLQDNRVLCTPMPEMNKVDTPEYDESSCDSDEDD